MENSFNFTTGNTLVSPEDLQQGIACLSRGAYFGEASLDMTLSILTESAASICGVERASIWALTDDHRELRCLALFERSTRRLRRPRPPLRLWSVVRPSPAPVVRSVRRALDSARLSPSLAPPRRPPR